MRATPRFYVFGREKIFNSTMLCHDLEMNLAEHAESMAAGQHPGYDPYAWDGIQQSIDAIAVKRIKIIINGGALNPQGLAVECQKLVSSRGYDLKVAYVGGDNLLDEVRDSLTKTGTLPAHLDSSNPEIQTQAHTNDLLDTQGKPVVSANAYLGARAIVKGLEAGADIIICGRVADASPVIAAAWYWHEWKETDYGALAGALIAGHLIECSAYVTGSNFSGFTEYDLETFVDLAFGIVEVDTGGSCVVTKHEGTKGLVNVDVVKCQFLYELQGDVYLNSKLGVFYICCYFFSLTLPSSHPTNSLFCYLFVRRILTVLACRRCQGVYTKYLNRSRRERSVCTCTFTCPPLQPL